MFIEFLREDILNNKNLKQELYSSVRSKTNTCPDQGFTPEKIFKSCASSEDFMMVSGAQPNIGGLSDPHNQILFAQNSVDSDTFKGETLVFDLKISPR